MYILGFDIGGTKCAVNTALWDDERVTLLKKERCPTDLSVAPEKMIEKLIGMAEGILDGRPDSIGISSGGPLDSERGVILGPPNLPGWGRVEIKRQIEEHFGVCAHLENDANACAVAEWKFGAGRGTNNMVFLTFGTGLGAGLILDGKLYRGTNGNAGEVGHIRLEPTGPVGFGKAGSFEGFSSGGGIAKLAWSKAKEAASAGVTPAYYREGMTERDVTAGTVAEAAFHGDETAREVYRISGEKLGRGLSVLIDILNPERIVIGSVFARSGALLRESMEKELLREALAPSLEVCKIVPAELGENIGDYASVAAALL
ncbi:MAG: ROK family protein [Clostridia bacterium]|nr:ROK family protein [Clostridia bacterium]